jgi:hypothetical protein
MIFMTKTKTVRQLAEDRGWTFDYFTAQCLMNGIKYDVAYEVWNGYQRKHRDVTKNAIARVLGVDAKDISWSA